LSLLFSIFTIPIPHLALIPICADFDPAATRKLDVYGRVIVYTPSRGRNEWRTPLVTRISGSLLGQ
jgi:hypothetical protein